MKVNVFVTRIDGVLRNSLLVLPKSPTAPPPPGLRQGWSYFATTNIDDKIFGSARVEDDIARQGYCLVAVTSDHP